MGICMAQAAFSMEVPEHQVRVHKHVKESATYPKLIVFDFHGTLSLDTGSLNIGALKARLKKYALPNEPKALTVDGWLTLMNRAATNNDLKPEDMMPHLNDVIDFISGINAKSHHTTKFAIASNAEQDAFVLAIMNYCFAARGKHDLNPFNENNVIGIKGLSRYEPMPAGEGKLKHISVILRNLGWKIGEDIQYSDMVLIDNSSDDLKRVKPAGVKPIQVKQYFRIEEWNNQYK